MVYQVSQDFPREEVHGLTSRVRRAAVSAPSNLSEGAARASRKEFSHFLSVAKGSLSELETQLESRAPVFRFPISDFRFPIPGSRFPMPHCPLPEQT